MKYYVPMVCLEQLNKLVKSLQKKTEVKYEVFEDDIHMETFYEPTWEDGVLVQKKYQYRVIGVELECDYKLGDYELVAKLEHTGEGNIISSINQEIKIPESYRTCRPHCEHCNTLRYRKDTFLLVDNNHNFKQVGKSCLNDYTGIDAEFIVNKLTGIYSILCPKSEMDEELKELLKAESNTFFDIDTYLNRMYQVVIKYGYDPKKDSYSKAFDKTQYVKELEPKVEEIKQVVNTKWNNGSDYCHNIEVIIKLGYDDGSHFRLLFSFVNSAINYLNRQVEINNEYLGNVGDKVEFEVLTYKVLFANDNNYHYNPYNTTVAFTYRIVTKTHQVVIWKTEKYLDDYKIKNIKATIKGLKDYKGEKQTVITRGYIEEQKAPKEIVEFNGKQYDKNDVELPLDMFLAECDGQEVDWSMFER